LFFNVTPHMVTTSAQEIKKINIAQLRNMTFCNSVGYFTDCELRDRHHKLHLSILLADHANSNVKIVFNTIDGYRELCTSVWGATEKYILIKGGSFIPVGSVAWISV
jgi:hypothetical protein